MLLIDSYYLNCFKVIRPKDGVAIRYDHSDCAGRVHRVLDEGHEEIRE